MLSFFVYDTASCNYCLSDGRKSYKRFLEIPILLIGKGASLQRQHKVEVANFNVS